MPAPRTPSDFQSLISDPSSSLCGNFINSLLKLPTYLWQLVDWLFDSSGNISTAARNQIVRPGDLIFSAAGLAEDATRLLCDGRQVSQTTYAALYAAIGLSWGASPTAGNFFLPDYRAKFPVGVGVFAGGSSVILGQTVGEDAHVLTDPETGFSITHAHVTGRQMGGASTPAGQICLITGPLSGPDHPTLKQTAGSEDFVAGLLSDASGAYVQTGEPQLAAGGEIPAVTAHNNLPPAAGCFVYIST